MMVSKEKSEKLLKGPALAAYARRKAIDVGFNGKGMKLTELVWKIQEMEGSSVCFKKEKSCQHITCCWQLSCGAKMG